MFENAGERLGHFLLETDQAFSDSVERVVLAAAHIETGMNFRSALANKDLPGTSK